MAIQPDSTTLPYDGAIDHKYVASEYGEFSDGWCDESESIDDAIDDFLKRLQEERSASISKDNEYFVIHAYYDDRNTVIYERGGSWVKDDSDWALYELTKFCKVNGISLEEAE